ncbi:MAG TPA: hypothetical protein VEM41_04390 [Actinomycetota bacterium]|nr:hypothetical protein [Actinomycetota bacterium]
MALSRRARARFTLLLIPIFVAGMTAAGLMFDAGIRGLPLALVVVAEVLALIVFGRLLKAGYREQASRIPAPPKRREGATDSARDRARASPWLGRRLPLADNGWIPRLYAALYGGGAIVIATVAVIVAFFSPGGRSAPIWLRPLVACPFLGIAALLWVGLVRDAWRAAHRDPGWVILTEEGMRLEDRVSFVAPQDVPREAVADVLIGWNGAHYGAWDSRAKGATVGPVQVVPNVAVRFVAPLILDRAKGGFGGGRPIRSFPPSPRRPIDRLYMRLANEADEQILRDWFEVA